jgi:anti-anti-sigma regulatory factor
VAIEVPERTTALEISVSPTWLVRLAGDLGASTVDRLGSQLNRPGTVVVDCSELASIDAVGVAALALAIERARANGYQLVVMGLSGDPSEGVMSPRPTTPQARPDCSATA